MRAKRQRAAIAYAYSFGVSALLCLSSLTASLSTHTSANAAILLFPVALYFLSRFIKQSVKNRAYGAHHPVAREPFNVSFAMTIVLYIVAVGCTCLRIAGTVAATGGHP